jgi:hypothetical protein
MAKVVVRMRNQGIEAYRPEDFGHTIIVERSISAAVRPHARAATPGRARSNILGCSATGPFPPRPARRAAPRGRETAGGLARREAAAALHHVARRVAHVLNASRRCPFPSCCRTRERDRRARRR